MNMLNNGKNGSAERQHMIDGHLLPNNVTDQNVVDAIASVDRRAFVPEQRRGVAYIDKSIKVAPGRYMMEPLALAKLLSSANIQEHELVLDIAPTTGYSSAVLSKMAEAVVAIEEDKSLADIATKNLADENCDNVAVINAPHKAGLANQGPYDLIFIGGMIDEVPAELLEQLNDGGRVLCVLNQNGFGRGALVTYENEIMGARILFDISAPKLAGFDKVRGFEF